jgi:hypothetical protein
MSRSDNNASAITCFVIERPGGKIWICEIHPCHENGMLKKFVLDGDGVVWMPYDRPGGFGRKPEPFGKLLMTYKARDVEKIQDTLATLCADRDVVIVPAKWNSDA